MQVLILFFGLFLNIGWITCFTQTENYINISPEKFKARLASEKGILLDVRTPNEFAQGHIPGAINLDFYTSDFEQKLKKLATGKTAFIYCAAGGRSAKAAAILKSNDAAPIYNLSGGIAAWQKAGYLVVK